MWNFAIGPLELAQEIQRDAGVGKIALGIKRQGSPERVPAEKPGETRALASARGAIARD